MGKGRTASQALAEPELVRRAFTMGVSDRTSAGKKGVPKSPKKKKGEISKGGEGMENAPKPETFLDPKGQLFAKLPMSLVIGHNNAFGKGEEPFPQTEFSMMKVGDLAYVPFNMEREEGEETEDYGYLGKIIHKAEDGTCRVHFTDCAREGTAAEDEEEVKWADYTGEARAYLVRARGSDERAQDTGKDGRTQVDEREIERFIKENKKGSTWGEERRTMLKKAIVDAVKDGVKGEATETLKDIVTKRCEEFENIEKGQWITTFGQQDKNVELIMDYLEGRGNGVKGPNIRSLDELYEKLALDARQRQRDIETRLKAVEGAVGLKKVSEQVRTQVEGQDEEKEVQAKPPPEKAMQAGLLDMEKNGHCCFYALAKKGQLVKDPEAVYRSIGEEDMQEARAKVAENGLKYREQLDQSETTPNGEEGWMEFAAESIGAFLDRVVYDSKGPPAVGPSKWGGLAEIALHGLEDPTKTIVIDADPLRKGMALKEARQYVHVAECQDDTEKKLVMVLVRRRSHFYIGILQEPKVKGLFAIGEESDKAVNCILQHVIDQSACRADKEALQRMQGEERRQAILAAMNQGGLSAVKPKEKPRKHVQFDDDAEWQQPRKRSVSMRVTSEAGQAGGPTVGCLVVYTTIGKERLLEDIKKDEQVWKCILSARQKQGHVILEALRSECDKLRGYADRLREQGYQVKPYYFTNSNLAARSKAGLDEQVKEQGLCWNYARGETCKFGARCKFKCYKDKDE